ncbi:MAG: GNAT family N-acetyltransferase [Pseudomonadota bacterium]
MRRLEPGDIAGFRAMNAVFAAGFEEPEHYAALPPSDLYAMQWLANQQNVALLAEESGKAIGALGGYILSKFEQERSEFYIYDLAVLESHRRKGVATALIEETRRIARAVGAWTVFVQADTIPEDEPARALYRSLASEELTALHFDIQP